MTLATAIVLASAAAGLSAQTVEWAVRDTPIEAAGPDVPTVEPHLAVDPSDPDHLLVATIVAGPEGPPWHCAALASFDGGGSWSRTDFDEMERCIDPWIVALPGDTAVFAAIEIRSDGEGYDRFRLNLHRSTDGGRTWTAEPDTLARRFEHPILVAGGTGHGGALYLGALVFGRSDEGDGPLRRGWVGRLDAAGAPGATHAVEARGAALLGPARDLIVTGVAPLSDGALVVTYRDFHGRVEGSGEDAAERARGWAVRSEDDGRSFGAPVLADSACASGGLARAFPGYPTSTAGGSTGPSGDRLYHACVRRSLEGVAVTRSLDGGRSWSAPLRVDRSQGAGGTPHARTPMLAVGPGGRVAVAWYDRRHDPERRCQDVYMAVSNDGGDTFAHPVRVTERTSCPEGEGNGRVARSWPMGGDYGAMAAGPDGTFQLVWADSRGGAFRLRRAAFRVVGGRLPARTPPVREIFGDPMEISAVREFLGDGGFGERSPRAPEALSAFGRLAGIWIATQEVRKRDGGWVEGEPSLWIWKYALGGFAVRDLWYQARDRLPDYLGELDRDYLLTSMRVYDVGEERWKIAWMANGAGEAPGKDFGTMEATESGGRIVMTSPPGEYGLQRVVFSGITLDSFRWVSHYSQDEGETWTPVMRVHARRYR